MMRWLFFPLFMGATWAAAFAGFATGVHLTVIVGAVMVAVWCGLSSAERGFPWRRDWHPSPDEAKTDLAHNVLNSLGFEVAKAGLVVAVAPLARLGVDLWPHAWPLLAQVGLSLLINEAMQYGLHRYAHESGESWLWRMHAVHHAPRRVYWFNAAREHPVSSALFLGAGMAPLLALGIGERALALHALTTAVLGYFQHVNLDVRLGPLNWVIGGVELHRWHHSTQLGPSRSNYGDNLVLMDLMFGTYHRPVTPDVGEVGIPGVEAPAGWWAQVRGAMARRPQPAR
jgi:sterol desaturase/sphingolipid hydroxylase (fatty acid hydroxylase superfamily)